MGTRVQLVSSTGETREASPLELAVWNNSIQMVRFLIDQGDSPGSADAYYLALLAVQHNPDPEVMELLLQEYTEGFQHYLETLSKGRGKVQDKRGNILICQVTTSAKHPGPVDRLLDFGWSKYINHYVCSGKSPDLFEVAVRQNPHPEVLQVLLDHGAEIEGNGGASPAQRRGDKPGAGGDRLPARQPGTGRESRQRGRANAPAGSSRQR